MSPHRSPLIGETSGQGNCPGLVAEADWVPSSWNFLLKLERDRLVCEGNGRPVDAVGWRRLRSIQGAGNEVPAKSRKIGVKNHGLKTAFTIGDEIRLSSAGCSIIQTLYARNPGEAPRGSRSPIEVRRMRGVA
ncbi:MAG: hypothetical protein OXC14_20810 [Rhodospirillaceae bacterium]|nr:hypothetical protein [Rhodospirillaceae bacterium]